MLEYLITPPRVIDPDQLGAELGYPTPGHGVVVYSDDGVLVTKVVAHLTYYMGFTVVVEKSIELDQASFEQIVDAHVPA